ncbi:MAG: glycosyltransferase family protein [Vulcanimicrobiaceae bacterium]
MLDVAAHLILGPRDEPFLGTLLDSLVGAVDRLIVNDNAPDPSPHADALSASWFGRSGQVAVDRTPFTDFSAARNTCLRMHAELEAGTWVAFVDADEVHGATIRNVARRLSLVPSSYDFVDGYTWHFFASFDLYTSIERRMAFFRFKPDLRWRGRVHEQLVGLSGKRLALPYVYAHYGHVLSARRHAEKGRQYSSLGQAGAIVAREELDRIDVADYFRTIWPTLLPFRGKHPQAAARAIALLRERYRADQLRALELVREAQRSPWIRARNALLAANYEQRWRARALDPLARGLVAD